MTLSRLAPKARTLTRIPAIGIQVAIIILAGFALAIGAETAPQPGPLDPHAGMSIGNLSRQSSLAKTMFLVDDPVFYAQGPGGSDSAAGVYGYEPKSSKRAFAQSFLIPGWGQWYNGSRIKPFVFLGLEAAGWVGVSQFHSSGQKKQNQYQKFADDPVKGWDYQEYLRALQEVYGVASDTMRYINPDWHCPGEDCLDSTNKYKVFSHHISFDADGKPVKNQTYYENVGKYDQFSYGWRDFEDSITLKTPNRDSYLDQRANANREFNRATTVLMLTLGNHLLSAFEAALGATRHNKSMDQFGAVGAHLRLARSQTDGKLFPKLYVGYRF
jgi:hypothetical protein